MSLTTTKMCLSLEGLAELPNSYSNSDRDDDDNDDDNDDDDDDDDKVQYSDN